MKFAFTHALLIVALTSSSESACAPVVTPSELSTRSPNSEVLVVGVTHLKYMKKFRQGSLDSFLKRLQDFKPDIIAIEEIGTEQCQVGRSDPDKYGVDYCPNFVAAHIATGLTAPEASRQIEHTLSRWPERPSPEARRSLAALFLAADDAPSALAHWLQLPRAERHAGDGLSRDMVAILETKMTLQDESFQISARLAARLGHSRIYPVDDHTGDVVKVEDKEKFSKSVEKAWAAGSGYLNKLEAEKRELITSSDLLPYYQKINQPSSLRAYEEANAGSMMRASATDVYPEIWIRAWEVRNFRIASNILEAARERPGARVLVIIGVAHKPWLDRLLREAIGINVADAVKVLSSASIPPDR